MRQRLRGLLLVVGTVATANGLWYLTKPLPGATLARLRDAGLDDVCAPRVVTCPVRLSPDIRRALVDAGVTDPGRYARMQLPAYRCQDDGGTRVVFPRNSPIRRLVDDTADVDIWDWRECTFNTCAERPGVCPLAEADVPFSFEQHPCAWRPLDAGAASCRFVDGGNPGWENTYPANRLTGAGCRRKACRVVAGEEGVP